MSSNNKRLSSGLAVAFALGVAGTSVVHAGNPGAAFTDAQVLTHTRMNELNTAVADNDARISAVIGNTQAGALKTAVDNLNNNIASGNCGTGMTRVGPICVNNTRTANGSVSWVAAVNACRTAGKRLLTPGEYIAALNSGLFADMVASTPNQYEWVDAISSDHSVSNTIPGAGAGRMTVGYMGPDDGSNLGAGEIFFGTNAEYDNASFTFIGYRCGR